MSKKEKELWLNWQFFLHQFKSRNQILSSFFAENILADVIKLLKKQKLLLSNRVWDIWFMMAPVTDTNPWFSLIMWSKKNSWITKICYNLQWLQEYKSIWNQMWKAFNDPQYYPIKRSNKSFIYDAAKVWNNVFEIVWTTKKAIQEHYKSLPN